MDEREDEGTKILRNVENYRTTAQLHIPDEQFLQNPESRTYARAHKRRNMDLSPPQTSTTR